MRQIRGKTALVTGAASGIGRAIALKLADEGARLYLLDVNSVALAAVVAEAKRRGVDAIGRHCDVSQPAEVTSAVHHLLDRFGGVDILINNAGITYYGQTLYMSAENWDRVLAVNLQAPIQFTRELLPTLLSRRESHVLNVASIFGLIGMGRITAYATTKFALVGFSESLRSEFLRRGLGVTALCPGFVDTNLFAAAPRGQERQENKTPPRWLMASTDRIAARAIRAIYRNQAMVVVQPYARLLHLVKRFTPGLFDFANGLSRKPHDAAPAYPAQLAADSSIRRAA